MSMKRRSFLKSLAVTPVALSTPSLIRAARADDPIKMGVLLDQSGGIEMMGSPMLEATKLAVKEINGAGGLLGRQVSLIPYDPQTTIQFYTQFATQAAAGDRVDVVHGAITSASREAIRPVLDRYQTLYFYNTFYEGGVCDNNTFCTGSTPAQTVEKLIPYAMKKWGSKVYVLAADYNYGQITSQWVKKYVTDNGGQVQEVEFFPLDVTNFGPTLKKIEAAKPDFVVSALVGAAHISFYKQYAAAGLKAKIPLASTVFSAGGEQTLLGADETEGMLVSFAYFEEVDTPENATFLKNLRAGASSPVNYVGEVTARSYEGVHLWAEGVRKAGSVDREAVVKALRSPISYTGPSGTTTIDAQTNHLIQNIYIAEIKNRKISIVESFPKQPPSDTRLVCDLNKNPDQQTFYFENGLTAAGIK